MREPEFSNYEDKANSFFVFALNNDSAPKKFSRLSKFRKRIQANDTNGLMLFDSPAELVATNLEDSARAEAILRAWTREAVQHLQVLREHRSKILVLQRGGGELSRAASAAFHSACPNQPAPPELAAAHDSPNALALAIGTLAVQQDLVVSRLVSELEASSPAKVAAMPSLAENLEVIAAELKAERERNQEGTIARRQLLQQIIELQESLRVTEEKRKKAEQKCTELEPLRSELDQVYRSTSWRMTAPIRAAKRLIKR